MSEKIFVIKYGETEISENQVFRGKSKNVMLPISLVYYLIEIGNRKILVDVGCDTMPGFNLTLFKNPSQVLESNGISADEITDIIITHAHHDHIDGAKHYKNAEVYIQIEEYKGNENYLKNCKNVVTFEDGIQLDKKICVIKIGGHSVGSSVAVLESDEKKFLFCGDECYVNDCFVKGIPTGNSINPEISEEFLEAYGGNDYVRLLFHDYSFYTGQLGMWQIK